MPKSGVCHPNIGLYYIKKKVGFKWAGDWLNSYGNVSYNLSKYKTRKDVFYAFVEESPIKGDAVMYIDETYGKTLDMRMQDYCYYNSLNKTDNKIHKDITASFKNGNKISIYVLPSLKVKIDTFKQGLKTTIINHLRESYEAGWN